MPAGGNSRDFFRAQLVKRSGNQRDPESRRGISGVRGGKRAHMPMDLPRKSGGASSVAVRANP
eukprot:4780970-Alexandrium_andersonii.AAC.1